MTHLLAALACLGHLVLMVGSHNLLYGLRAPKWFSGLVHVVHALAVLALPIGLVAGWGWSLAGLRDRPVMLAYLALCLAALFVLLPLVSLARALRPDPLRYERREVVDLTRQLGRKPVGLGNHPFLARLPGNGIFHVEFVEAALALPGLPPALDGLTVLHLSDLHFHGTPDREWFAAIIERCNAWKPDIVALTGDVIDSPTHHRWILPLLGRLRWGVAGFAILGNHDHYFEPEVVRRRLRRLGFTVLVNEWAMATVRGTPVAVVGNEYPWLEPEPDLAGMPEGFKLCLSHTPDNFAWAARHGMDLVLAGHVHGGQIRLPLIGPVVMPSRYGRRFDQGGFRDGKTVMVVSRGLSGEEPVRYNCLPEAMLLTLRCQPLPSEVHHA
ncbi:MAG: metallophosphoesterase [Gemmataceae bacterium]|nr:metallophosphoesterase [Gemmataceae bacterium]